MRISYCLWAILSLLIGTRAFCLELDPALDKQAKLIFSEVFSPFCVGRLLQDCPSSEATVLKENIKQMLLDGKSKQEVMQYLTGLYGNDILAEPELRGFSALVWYVPIGFLALGFITLLVWLRKCRQSTVTEA